MKEQGVSVSVCWPLLVAALAGISTMPVMAATTGSGAWGPVISMPAVPVGAANLANGKILTWSSYNPYMFEYAVDHGQTYTSTFDPLTNSSSLRLVDETQHDMFCTGSALLPDGRVMVSGGSSAAPTSLYESGGNSWARDDDVNITRAYHSNTVLADGSVLTLGGSWLELYTGNAGNRTAELWTEADGWKVLNGIPADSMETNDRLGPYRSDNHMWLFTVAGGKVLHAGPSKRMHLLDASGNGSFSVVGNRADDGDAMNGSAVMYDIGKVLTTGGAPHYENSDATDSAFIVETNGSTVTSRRIQDMDYERAYHNTVVLPNGEVVVIGGQAYPVPFSDAQSAMVTELWSPETEQFRSIAPLQEPRNYHSVALLLPDGRVLAGGGGLCGDCSTNHANVEILTPPYLLNSNGSGKNRPVILSAPASAAHGDQISVRTDSPIDSLVMMRSSAVTHTVNNDQRRVPLSFTVGANNTYTAQLPSDPGVLLTGNYMLFALYQNETPSVSTLINVTLTPSPKCNARTVTVDLSKGQVPTNGNDVILGTSASETIDGLDGHDFICGGGGDDIIHGGNGWDWISGGDGNDIIYAGANSDRVFGGGGDDEIYGSWGNDRLYGQGGNDKIYGEQGNDKLYGGSQNDSLDGGPGSDRMWGEAGDDLVLGGDGDDTWVDGGDGDDRVSGQNGNDIVRGGDGADKVYGGPGNDDVRAQSGDDLITDGGNGIDSCQIAPGVDVAPVRCE